MGRFTSIGPEAGDDSPGGGILPVPCGHPGICGGETSHSCGARNRLGVRPERLMAAHRRCRPPSSSRATLRERRAPVPGLPDLRQGRIGGALQPLRLPSPASPPERDVLAIAHVDCDAFFAPSRNGTTRHCRPARDYRRREARGRIDLLLRGAYLWREIRHADVQGAGGLSACGRVSPTWRNIAWPGAKSAADAGPDALGRAGFHRRSLSRSIRHRAPAPCQSGGDAGALCPARGGRSRDHRLDRPVLQQVPGQDRLGSRQAARLLDHRARGGAALPGRQAGLDHSRHRRRRTGTARKSRRDRIGISATCRRSSLFGALGRDSTRLAGWRGGRTAGKSYVEHETKSVSAETTFDTDLRAFDDLEPVLWRLAEKVSRRLKEAGLAGRSIILKLKDSEFRLHTDRARGCRRPNCGPAVRSGAPTAASACDGTAFRLSESAPSTFATQPKRTAAIWRIKRSSNRPTGIVPSTRSRTSSACGRFSAASPLGNLSADRRYRAVSAGSGDRP